jgi:hypothetical protein
MENTLFSKFHLNFTAIRRNEVVITIATIAAKLKLTFIESKINSIVIPAKLAEA